MKEYIKIAFILAFIFSFWFTPSSPFLVKWLTQSKDFTAEQVYEDLFPLWSYSQFALVPAGLFAQFVSFRALFVFGSLLSLASNAFLIWGDTMWWMRGSEIANGAAVGTFGIFLAYIYTAFPQERHQRITSFARAVTLIATTASSSTGQLIVDATHTVLVALYVSIGMGIANCLTSLFLPSPLSSSPPPSPGERKGDIQEDSQKQKNSAIITTDGAEDDPYVSLSPSPSSSSLRKHWRIFLANYNPSLLMWTGWSGACIAIHMLVLTYWQSVMNQINPNVNYNGYVSTVAYALAAAVTLIPTKIEPFLHRNSEYLLILMPILYGICLFLLSRESIIYLAYIWLILYHSLFEFALAVSSVQVARRTGKPKQFGIVFSLNMLVALIFQNITQVLVGKQVFDLSPTSQYEVYAFIFFGISVVCLIWLLWLKLARKQNPVVVEKYTLI
eukprot:Phypoly_transcript_08432.p1 GENE.Phypoly_transcript_08432~~Phypoly_transcript_08432.p1  ORF type:complete len:444 (+),score=65.76 Phypoly_transcript_08432:178-1509(+)